MLESKISCFFLLPLLLLLFPFAGNASFFILLCFWFWFFRASAKLGLDGEEDNNEDEDEGEVESAGEADAWKKGSTNAFVAMRFAHVGRAGVCTCAGAGAVVARGGVEEDCKKDEDAGGVVEGVGVEEE